jgi:POT family proton-dependent oligopeptide transporter
MEPVWVIVLSPLFALAWTRLGNRAPTTPRKFAYGVVGMGAAFLLFLPMAASPGRTVPVLMVALILGVFAVSELLISPIGLAVTTQLAPQAFRSQMMALFFLSAALGTALSGVLAKYYAPDHEVAYFGALGVVAVTVGAAVFAIAGRISRLMPGVH